MREDATTAPAGAAGNGRSDGIAGDDDSFRQLVEALPQIIFIAGADGGIEYFNRHWYDYTGLPASAHDTEDWIAAIHPDDLPGLLRRRDQAVRDGESFEAEYRLRRHDGVYRWHLGRSTPLTDGTGKAIRRFGTATDIAEQKAAAEDLRYSAILVRHMAEAAITTDPRFVIRGWNPAATELYGWAEEEVVGRLAHDVLQTHFPNGDADRRAWLATVVEQGRWQGEVIQRRKDGTPVTVAATVTMIHDAAGALLGMTAINRDITAQRRLEDNLRFLAEASKVLGSSLDYRTTLATLARLGVPEIADWCAVDMRSETGAIGRLAVAHVDPEKVAWAIELNQARPPDPDAPTGLPNVLRTGQSEFIPVITEEMLAAAIKSEEDLALVRRVGFSSVIIVPLTVQGRTIGALTFVAAESGRHYTQADLAFAEEVAARAALAVENARLYTAAQAAVAVRDEFMALASHELKTPVTSLKMYTQVLQRQADRRGESDLATRLGRMDRQLDKLTGLINDLLDVARIQGGRIEYTDESVDLNAVVQEAVADVQPTAAKHGITVEGIIAGRVWGDRERLGQVITNLLTNAVKYSPAADRVLVRLDGDEQCATIAVQDFGIGIAAEHLSHIFEQFYRVSDPSEKTFPGLGIGLYIAGEIVRRHGGEIRVASEPGAGTIFTVALPIRRQATMGERGTGEATDG
jgi:PAS domain S-box-containing protein